MGVFAGVGERTREGNDLYHEMMASGVIKENKAPGSKAALVYGQMNEPPGARARVGLTGLTVAEYFRDEENQDVLLFVDNIFRFTQACSEVSALLGRIPSAVGYQPTLATDLGALQEKLPPPRTVPLPPSRPCSSPLMISPIPPPLPPSPIWMPRPCCPETPPGLQVPPGYHCHSRYGRSLRRG